MSSSDELSVSTSGNSAAPTPGQQLKLAREACGLSLEAVNAETNLSVKYLQALEADDFGALPGLAFARGYARRYAQLVNLDGATLIAEIDALAAAKGLALTPVLTTAIPTVERGNAAISQVNTRKVSEPPGVVKQLAANLKQVNMSQLLSMGSLFLLLLLLLGTLFWQGNNDADIEPMPANGMLDIDADMASSMPPEAPVTPAVTATPAPVVAAAPVTAGTPSVPVAEADSAPAQTATDPQVIPVTPAAPVSATPAPAPVTPVAQPAPAPAPQASTPAPAPSAAAPVAEAPAARPAPTATIKPVAPVTAPPGIDSLNFSFTGKSWISVRDATGQELVYGLKNAGQAVTVTGQAPFSINIGNVHVTSLSRNGRAVNLKQYARGEIASFRLAPAAPATAPRP